MKPLLLSTLLAVLALLATAATAPAQPQPAVTTTEIGPHHKVLVAEQPNGGPPRTVTVLGTAMHAWNESTQMYEPATSALEESRDADGWIAPRILCPARISRQLNVRGAIAQRLPTGSIIYFTPLALVLADGTNSVLLSTLTNSTGVLIETNCVLFPSALGPCIDIVVRITESSIESDVCISGKLDLEGLLPPGFNPATASLKMITEFFQPEVPTVLSRFAPDQDSPAEIRAQAPDADETLAFGSDFVIGPGVAYASPGILDANAAPIPVSKQYVTTTSSSGGLSTSGTGATVTRHFLVESVKLRAISPILRALPDCGDGSSQGAMLRNRTPLKTYASLPSPVLLASAAPLPVTRTTTVTLKRPIPASPLLGETGSGTPTSPLLGERGWGEGEFPASSSSSFSLSRAVAPSEGAKLARASLPRQPSLTIDFRAGVGSGAVTLAANTTYLVASAVSCTSLGIEGCTTVKYKADASISVNGPVICTRLASFRPAWFTGIDDDAVGESMAGFDPAYTGTNNTPIYGYPALGVTNGTVLSHCRFRYARLGIGNSANTATIYITANHCQFVNCRTGIQIYGGGPTWGASIIANDVLLSNVRDPLAIYGALAGYVNYNLANCTLDQAAQLWLGINPAFTAYNCIFANVTNLTSGGSRSGNCNGFFNSAETFGTSPLSLSASPFQAAGGGSYYLTDASGLRNYGTSAGPPASLLADLKQRTTYPPIVIAGATWNTDQALTPQAQRDTDQPDCGWHYEPMDYELSSVLATNCAISMSNGTVIGTFGLSSNTNGLAIGKDASLTSVGLPNRPNWFVQYNLVQEQPLTNWFHTTAGQLSSEFQGAGNHSVINCRFTQFSGPAQATTHFFAPTNTGPLNFQDCEFNAGQVISVAPTVNFTNCLLNRVYTDIEPTDGLTTAFRNCLVWSGTFGFGPTNSMIADNAFYTTIPDWIGGRGNTYSGYNAYGSGQRLKPTKVQDITWTPLLCSGPLGNFYQLNSNATMNRGGTTANLVGLYHYTCCTNLLFGYLIKETTSVVDMGYHYIVTDSAGNPIDTDGDGICDILEDLNGNGVVDPGETSWTNYNSLNGLQSGAGLQVFTPLK